MIDALILWSIANRPLVLILALLLAGFASYRVSQLPLDAVPDLSDVQVIVKTTFPGQSPEVIEDQVTYPLSSAMLAVPGATHVRGYSFFGDSYVYVLFEDGTDPYWARTRVLEYLSQVRERLPAGASAELGPDASGVGWVYQYALVDRSGTHDSAELRSLQDWFLKYELQTVPGVAEVATVGGMVKQYQVVLDPGRIRAHELSLPLIRKMIVDSNREVGGSVIEMGEAEYMVRGRGYLQNMQDLATIPYVNRRTAGASLLLQDVAQVRIGPQARRGVAELDGEGEVTGGIVVMRWGGNALETIQRVKTRLDELRAGLPAGIEIVETYDRSALIERAVDTLSSRLVEEFIVVALVCVLFLMHLRSAMVIVFSLPLGVLAALAVMQAQGINANIMSLGGIAIAIGAMVDAAIVMIENVHRRLADAVVDEAGRLALVSAAMREVGAPLFYSLLIITLSFLPIFALEAQEGRLFAPLAYTKTYAMAAAAGLSVTLVPALAAYLIRGSIRSEHAGVLNRWLVARYRPLIASALHRPAWWIGGALLLIATSLWPLSRLGSEFMPPLDEGDLLYMPTTLPGISIGKVTELLQQTDRLIKSVPEVERVFGKAGRAETATDPAPLTMLETTIRLKPRSEWRAGVTLDDIIAELDRRTQVPGVSNAWLMPIQARIDMLATGIKTPVGVKIAGPDLAVIERIGKQVEEVVRGLPGTSSVLSERVGDGRYLDITIDREAAAHYGLNVTDLQDVIEMTVGGKTLTHTVEGRERYPVNVRYPQHVRDSLQAVRNLPVFLSSGQQILLSQVAHVEIKDGPAMIKTEDARLNGWVFISTRDRDIGSYVATAREAVAREVALPAGYSLSWSGQYQYLVRAEQRMLLIVPVTLALILVLLYLTFRNLGEALLVMVALPLALVGGVWMVYLAGYHLSVAVAVGFIALAGVAAEFGIVMLVYLDQAVKQHQPRDRQRLRAAVIEGTVLRVRPKAMTVAVIVAGLLPIMLGAGTGAEMMRHIAAPMIGGMLTAPLVSMLLLPVLYYYWQAYRLRLSR